MTDQPTNENSITFNDEMVRAILEGRKTQTRRIMKPQPVWREASNGNMACWYPGGHDDGKSLCYANKKHFQSGVWQDFCPYKVGERLWVREAWHYDEHMHDATDGVPDLPEGRYSSRLIYRASQPNYPTNIGVGSHGWTPSIHMPRWASRIILEITSIKVERLQDITEEDATAEGVNKAPNIKKVVKPYSDPLSYVPVTSRDWFQCLWDSIYKNKPGCTWDANPWVYAIEFKIKEPAND